MAHFERPERGGRQGHWRRRQHRLNGSDHFNNDNRSGGYEGMCRMGPRALQAPEIRGDVHTSTLDDITLKHMSQDCNFLKNQLLKLKTILQLEDETLVPETPESSEDSNALQLQELMREVHQLREELRAKDRIIAQLTQQQQHKQHSTAAVRCHCQQRAASCRGERRTHYDKSTQTPWRGPPPPILQPPNITQHQPYTKGSLAKTAHTEVPSDGMPPGSPNGQRALSCPSRPEGGATTTAITRRSMPLPDSEELSLLLSTQLMINDSKIPNNHQLRPKGRAGSLEGWSSAALAAARGGQDGGRHGEGLQSSRSLSHLPSAPRVLQPPRIHRRVTIPVLVQGDSKATSTSPEVVVPSPRARSSSSASSSSSAAISARQVRQLPPPSRGLPCFDSGPPASLSSSSSPTTTITTSPEIQPKPPGPRREEALLRGGRDRDGDPPPRPHSLPPISLLTKLPKLSHAPFEHLGPALVKRPTHISPTPKAKDPQQTKLH